MIFNRQQKCPCCGLDLQLRNLNLAHPFPCPHCHRELKVPRFYSTFLGLLSLVFSFLFWYDIGLRDLSLLAAGFVGWFPAVYVVALIMNRLFTPKSIPVDESIIR